MPIKRRPSCRAVKAVVPLPMKGSRTTPAGGAPARMQGRISSGGKVAKCAPSKCVSFSKNLESGMLPARVQPKPVPRNRVKVGKTPGLAYPHFRVCGLLVGHFCPTNSPARVRPRFYCFFSKSIGETPSTFMSIPRVRGKSELRLKTCQNRILYHLCAWKNSQGHFALEFGRLDSIWAAFLTSSSILLDKNVQKS